MQLLCCSCLAARHRPGATPRAAVPVRVPARAVRRRPRAARAVGGDRRTTTSASSPTASPWFFVLGWLVHRSTTAARKLLTTALCVLTLPGFFERRSASGSSPPGSCCSSGAARSRCRGSPSGRSPPIAAASMVIYVTHFRIWPVLDRNLDRERGLRGDGRRRGGDLDRGEVAGRQVRRLLADVRSRRLEGSPRCRPAWPWPWTDPGPVAARSQAPRSSGSRREPDQIGDGAGVADVGDVAAALGVPVDLDRAAGQRGAQPPIERHVPPLPRPTTVNGRTTHTARRGRGARRRALRRRPSTGRSRRAGAGRRPRGSPGHRSTHRTQTTTRRRGPRRCRGEHVARRQHVVAVAGEVPIVDDDSSGSAARARRRAVAGSPPRCVPPRRAPAAPARPGRRRGAGGAGRHRVAGGGASAGSQSPDRCPRASDRCHAVSPAVASRCCRRSWAASSTALWRHSAAR